MWPEGIPLLKSFAFSYVCSLPQRMIGAPSGARVGEQTATRQDPAADFTLGERLVQPSLNRIARGNEHFRLRPQLMDLLVCLASRAGQTVMRDEILATVCTDWTAKLVDVAPDGYARNLQDGIVRALPRFHRRAGAVDAAAVPLGP
jgi:hypothetical protein